jgi:DNA polymerase (family 10)
MDRNAEIAAALRSWGPLRARWGDRYRVLAYKEAARTVAQSPISVEQLAEEGRLTELPAIGNTLAEKIETLLETGSIPSADKLKKKFPATLVEVTRVPGLGAKTARRIYDEVGVENLMQLKEAAEQGRLAGIQGLGPRTEENILSSLEGVTEDGIGERLLLSHVLPIGDEICSDLKELGVANRIELAGSARRWAETCKDLDLIATTDDPAALADALATHGLSAETRRGGDAAASVLTHSGLQVDLRIGTEETFGNLLQHFTGSAAHNVQLRERAQARGLSVSENGVAKVEGKKVHSSPTWPVSTSCSDVPTSWRSSAREGGSSRPATPGSCRSSSRSRTSAATSTAIPPSPTAATPWRRWPTPHGSAATHTSPSPITPRHTASATTSAPGSSRSGSRRSAPGTSPPRGFRLLAGSEVNIGMDGEPDYPDELLAELDWVICSVHTSFTISERR